MSKNTCGKLSLDEEVKTLKKHFGGIIATVKSLKETVDKLEKKISKEENYEIKEIMETQKVIEEVIVANGDAIRRIDKEIANLCKETSKVEYNTEIIDRGKKRNKGGSKEEPSDESVKDCQIDNNREVREEISTIKVVKKCRYFNGGYCKYKAKCKYFHPTQICSQYLDRMKCEGQNCSKRHPKICKWSQKQTGCQRQGCAYLHEDIGNSNVEYKCISCNDAWNKTEYVKEHLIQNQKVYFCLNCDEWVKLKDKVLNPGWKLLDEFGYLNQGI